VLVIPVLFTIAVTAVAYGLPPGAVTWVPACCRCGRGPRPPGRPGQPLVLAWRLQRGTLLAWAAGLAVYGLVIGALATGIGPLVGGQRGRQGLFVKLGGQTGLVNALLAA
jgi:ABC-2 type transport system permease protein